MKKIFTLLLSFLITSSLVMGCSNETVEDNNKENEQNCG